MRQPPATGLQPPGSTGAADQYASHTTPASCAPGLPTLKGPMWSSLSITRTMPEARHKGKPFRQAMHSWLDAGAACCAPIEPAPGQVSLAVVPCSPAAKSRHCTHALTHPQPIRSRPDTSSPTQPVASCCVNPTKANQG